MLDPGEILVGEAEGGEIADVVDHGRLGGRGPMPMVVCSAMRQLRVGSGPPQWARISFRSG
jgi:hypothetical protein